MFSVSEKLEVKVIKKAEMKAPPGMSVSPDNSLLANPTSEGSNKRPQQENVTPVVAKKSKPPSVCASGGSHYYH